MNDWSQAIRVAQETREHAYVPYSEFKVGAAIKFTHSDTITGGCNVENGSYGATICAERGAIMKAIAEEGAGKLEYVVVVTDTEEPVSPCGVCQQVIGEFASNETRILMITLKGKKLEIKFSDLQPHLFRLTDHQH
jgi:cytidine deaminase